MADLFRMPRGVPREVARLIRTSTKKIPKAGQVLSAQNAFRLYDALAHYRKTLAKRSRKAAIGAEKARKPETYRKKLQEMAAARNEAVDSERAQVELERPEREVVALEWELGIDYFEEDGYPHRKGTASDVGFNARIVRYDGHPMSETEAREAWRYFAEYHQMPPEIRLEVVEWQRVKRGRKRWSKGTPEHDLAMFGAIIATVGDYGLYARPFRLGAVKGDAR